jgi:predicted nucleic acid-binding protein
MQELRRAFAYAKILRYVSRDEAVRMIQALEAGAVALPDPTRVPAVCRDPDDDYLFALALGAGAVLVSGDAGVLAVTDAGVRVVRPAAFAQLLEGPGNAT